MSLICGSHQFCCLRNNRVPKFPRKKPIYMHSQRVFSILINAHTHVQCYTYAYRELEWCTLLHYYSINIYELVYRFLICVWVWEFCLVDRNRSRNTIKARRKKTKSISTINTKANLFHVDKFHGVDQTRKRASAAIKIAHSHWRLVNFLFDCMVLFWATRSSMCSCIWINKVEFTKR